ncbi:acetyl-CoA acetyltransferase [Alicyclobacillus tolerans]|uniref:acetyl-CoA acetyltransferase n=1 Tax=Alicyclobacillus tolerans TaxID=90970 RepID=UPI001EED34F9|nr:acetyl-CoA acetyltransferase [Alicyclobacillus tolerans]MCF8565299.1 acetyl-CoA acetyltransferase [Alicyclobacillus tolerans]
MGMLHDVAVVGYGQTRFAENFDMDYFDMVIEATYKALDDARLGPEDVDAGWLGTCYAYSYNTEGNAGTSLAEPLALDIPVTRVSNYCTTGMDAIRNAAFAVGAGECEAALVVGVEKMRDVEPRGSLVAQHVGLGHPLYAKGRSAPGMFALMANRYREVYGNPRKAMTAVAVKNHFNGSLNPLAHFQSRIEPQRVHSSPMIADPLTLYDCCPTTDGAAAVVLMRADAARRHKLNRYAVIKGMGLAVTNGYFSAQFNSSWDFLGFSATREAARKAYAQAGIVSPYKEVDVAECHDCFTITEIINYEDLGFCERGQGTRFVLEGESSLTGKLPVNTSGGLKAQGHPIGASGVRMVGNIYEQLLERCGPRQVNGARTGLAHTLGGPGSVSCVMVLAGA